MWQNRKTPHTNIKSIQTKILKSKASLYCKKYLQYTYGIGFQEYIFLHCRVDILNDIYILGRILSQLQHMRNRRR